MRTAILALTLVPGPLLAHTGTHPIPHGTSTIVTALAVGIVLIAALRIIRDRA